MPASEKIDAPSGPPVAAPAKDAAPAVSGAASSTERFDEILVRLRGVVEKLEGGNLSLEDSLKFFEEGIGLCRRGATILDSAERKVEVLLAGSSGGQGANSGNPANPTVGGGTVRTVPFDVPAGDDD